jgi:hypothetical protein
MGRFYGEFMRGKPPRLRAWSARGRILALQKAVMMVLGCQIPAEEKVRAFFMLRYGGMDFGAMTKARRARLWKDWSHMPRWDSTGLLSIIESGMQKGEFHCGSLNYAAACAENSATMLCALDRGIILSGKKSPGICLRKRMAANLLAVVSRAPQSRSMASYGIYAKNA